MDRDELLKMLDLGGKEAAPPEADDLAVEPAITKPAPRRRPRSLSPTALELDDWALRQGKELLAESEKLQALGLGEHAVADFHAAAFLPEPKLLDDCVDPLRKQFLEQLFLTPEYQALHSGTTLQQAASAVAATSFAEQFAALKKEAQKEAEREREKAAAPEEDEDEEEAEEDETEADDEEGEEEEDEEGEEGKGPKGAGGGAGSGPAGGRTRGSTEEADLAGEMAILRAVGRALEEASAEVEELREAATAFGMGRGEPGSNDPRAIAALFRRVRNSPTLRRICELAGRYRRVAQSQQRQKVSHGLDDVVGVTLGGDLSRLLPVELARLALPELELDTLRRLVERQCMQREHHSLEPVAKGPIIVCVDESGSMQGEKVHTAKALALALAWLARQQGRWCALVAYSGDTGERLLPLPPGRWDEGSLADWLCAFIGCGSSLDVPVREMPRIYTQFRAPLGRTDVLFVTDALCHIPADVRETFLCWKRSVGARLLSLVIWSEPGDLLGVSDECHRVRSLSLTEDAVERVLAL